MKSLQWLTFLCTCSGPRLSLWPHSVFYPLFTWLQSYWLACQHENILWKQQACFYLRIFTLAVCTALNALQISSYFIFSLPLGLYSNITFIVVCKIGTSFFLPFYYFLSSFSAYFSLQYLLPCDILHILFICLSPFTPTSIYVLVVIGITTVFPSFGL